MGLLDVARRVFGVSDADIDTVFKHVIERIDRVISDKMTKAARDGGAVVLCAMLDELRSVGVVSDARHDALVELVKEWHRKERGSFEVEKPPPAGEPPPKM